MLVRIDPSMGPKMGAIVKRMTVEFHAEDVEALETVKFRWGQRSDIGGIRMALKLAASADNLQMIFPDARHADVTFESTPRPRTEVPECLPDQERSDQA